MNYFQFNYNGKCCEVELLCSRTGNAVATIMKNNNELLQTEFNLYHDIDADNKIEYPTWDYSTEQVIFKGETFDPFAAGFEYVQNEVEFYLITKALWKTLNT